jgi:hypothetical protein
MRMAAVMAVIAGGCNETGDTRPRSAVPPSTPATSAGYRVVEDLRVGSVSGTVRWRGEVPRPVEVEVRTHRDACGEVRRIPSAVVGPRGGVAGAVVMLEGVREGRLPLGGEVRFILSGCELSPRVAVASVGALLRFENQEALLHNIRISSGRETWLDVGLPQRGSTTETTARPGIHRIVDDAAHPWIESWLYVADHPYIAVTGADGRFQLPRVPVGSYQLRVWHPGIVASGDASSGRPARSAPIVLARPISIAEAADSTTDFELDASSIEAAGAVAPL